RVRHWTEEIQLLQEEMKRCLLLLDKQANDWNARSVILEFQGAHAEGVAAYAHKQAVVQKLISSGFRNLWSKYLSSPILDQ
ncbi:hypothetical protein BT96DRAFT_788949, partial [Gymnopus androsaceus JB14]